MLAERLSKRIGEHPSTFYPLHAGAASPPFRLSDFSLSAYPPCHAVVAKDNRFISPKIQNLKLNIIKPKFGS
jgi:hypothetical protein